MAQNTTSNRPTHNVFSVVKKNPNDKAFWLKIGAAWQHQDGTGFNIVLQALPMPGYDVVMLETKGDDDQG